MFLSYFRFLFCELTVPSLFSRYQNFVDCVHCNYLLLVCSLFLNFTYGVSGWSKSCLHKCKFSHVCFYGLWFSVKKNPSLLLSFTCKKYLYYLGFSQLKLVFIREFEVGVYFFPLNNQFPQWPLISYLSFYLTSASFPCKWICSLFHRIHLSIPASTTNSTSSQLTGQELYFV